MMQCFSSYSNKIKTTSRSWSYAHVPFIKVPSEPQKHHVHLHVRVHVHVLVPYVYRFYKNIRIIKRLIWGSRNQYVVIYKMTITSKFFFFWVDKIALILRRREIHYILSQQGLNHRWVFLFLGYITINTLGIMSQDMSRLISLSLYMWNLYHSKHL